MGANIALHLAFLVLLFECVLSSHFRGAIIMFQPTNQAGVIEFRHRIAWRRSSLGNFCDQTTIDSGTLLGEVGFYDCRSGCTGSLGSTMYMCTDFSVMEDFSTGEGTFTATIQSDSFEASYDGCCWLTTLIVGASASWSVTVRGDLTVRSDIGRINSSPVSLVPPIIRLQQGCNHIINIPVQDPDGDNIRCRFASAALSECNICNGLPGATLDQNGCTLTYFAAGPPGFYAVEIQVEDFATPSATVAMSSIPVQFLVEVVDTSVPCGSGPFFVPPTRADGTTVGVPLGSTYTDRIIAESGGANLIVSEIMTVSPSGLTSSALFESQSTPTRQWSIDVTWTPTMNQAGPNIFCYTALNSAGLTSTTSCITLVVGGTLTCEQLTDPVNGRVVMDGVSPGSIAEYSCGITFHLIGDETRVCDITGEWTGEAPTCQRLCLVSPME